MRQQTEVRNVTWSAFRDAAPELADHAQRLLYRGDEGAALLATVPVDAPPRIHPINVGIVGDGLYAFLLESPKRRDLEQDGRFALHAHIDPVIPTELELRGRALAVTSDTIRAVIAPGWAFTVDDSYRLFELHLESVLLGVREGPEAWPPRYSSWRAPSR